MSNAHRRRPALVLASLTLMLTACSQDPGSDSPAPDTADAATGTAQAPDAAGSTSAAPVDVSDRSVQVADDGTIVIGADQASFVMPSGNIQCVIRTDSAVCQISDKDFEPAPPDLSPQALGDCTTATADALTLLRGERAFWSCTSETIRGQAALDLGGWWAADGAGETELIDGTPLAVLSYGASIQLGEIVCSSENTGASCRLLDEAHGFSLARQDYLAG